MKLDFICVGTQKAGTTTLHNILKTHPKIFLPISKEAHFFDIRQNYEKGMKWWQDEFFSDCSDQEVVGVVTPSYLYFSEVPAKIKNDLGGNIKIIIILRNPIDRAFSHYLMSVRRELESLSFEEAIKIENDRIQKGEFENKVFSYMNRGLYYEQIKRYFQLFKRENILILNFERDIIENIEPTFYLIQDFLNIEPIALNTDIMSNPSSTPRIKYINKLFLKKNWIKNSLKLLIKSSKLKENILLLNEKWNRKNTSKNFKLSVEKKIEFTNTYFIEDIKKTEKLIDSDLSHWYL